MVSQRAAEYLAADVRNVIEELETLDNNIREMEAKREAVRVKLDLLKKAIGPDQIEMSLAKDGSASLPANLDFGTSDVSAEPSEGGFRVAIRAVLNESTRGMRPKEILSQLVKRGVPFTGKSAPISRTYNELWRMSKIGQVRKRGSLYYAQHAATGGGVQ